MSIYLLGVLVCLLISASFRICYVLRENQRNELTQRTEHDRELARYGDLSLDEIEERVNEELELERISKTVDRVREKCHAIIGTEDVQSRFQYVGPELYDVLVKSGLEPGYRPLTEEAIKRGGVNEVPTEPKPDNPPPPMRRTKRPMPKFPGPKTITE